MFPRRRRSVEPEPEVVTEVEPTVPTIEELEEPIVEVGPPPEEVVPPPPPGHPEPQRGVSDGTLTCAICHKRILEGEGYVKGIERGPTHEPCSHQI